MSERKYGIDSGWIVSEATACTCGMGRGSVYGHEAFCGLEQEAPVEEFDGWVKHMLANARRDALAEARDAVEALLPEWAPTASGHLVPVSSALAAIDALKGGSHE